MNNGSLSVIAGTLITYKANATSGVATLVAGVATISAPFITSGMVVLCTTTSLNSTPALGHLQVTVNPGIGFVVTSYSATGTKVTTDVSSFAWEIVDLDTTTVHN
jgi:hypothetical protein